jgi:hypothetical protein
MQMIVRDECGTVSVTTLNKLLGGHVHDGSTQG